MQKLPTQSEIASVVERYVDAAPAVPGVCVAIDGPDDRLLSVARGFADPAAGVSMTADHAVRIASCTKTFVASVVVDLAGRGMLDLDQPAIEVAPAEVAALLDTHETGRVFTVRHVLQHRSGLVDHTLFPEFLEPFRNDPDYEWTALAQLAIATRQPALYAPGEAFSYSDTGYVLLGEIIEGLTGGTLAAAVRTTSHLDESGVPSIHWERAEPTPPGLQRAHQFLDSVDTYDWNPTLDMFGGGGIVATMPDLARWWTALFEGRAHEHLDVQLADPQPTVGPGPDIGVEDVGLGIFRRHVDGVEVWSHGGFWGLQTLHIPAIRTSAALVITARGEDIPGPGVLADEVVRALVA